MPGPDHLRPRRGCRLIAAVALTVAACAAGPTPSVAQSSDATEYVWDVGRRCYKPRDQADAPCGVIWNTDRSGFETPPGAVVAPEPTSEPETTTAETAAAGAAPPSEPADPPEVSPEELAEAHAQTILLLQKVLSGARSEP